MTGTQEDHSEDARRRLGDEVSKRRHRLGRKQDQMSSFGGPSSRAMRDIEAGRMLTFTPSMLGKLDRALKWRDGAAERVLAGLASPEELDEVVERDTYGPGERIPAGVHDRTGGAAPVAAGTGTQTIYPDSIPSRARVGEPTFTVEPTTLELTHKLLGRLTKDTDLTPEKVAAVTALSALIPQLYEGRE